ncbi:MAG: polysaccharide biosynthesis protein [Deltaproteobacteria bacterium]|nr:polysaccharide biosynthesis protein [Deltaproteobacteria bacterium]
MSLAQKAARGALWAVISSMGGRAVGVIGTLVMTRFLHPEQIGEVSDAVILTFSASWLTIWGFGQYAVVKGRGPDAAEVTWHATVFYTVLGVVSLGGIALLGGPLTRFLDAPKAAEYIPLMALATFIRRLGAMPERVLVRELKFRASGMANLMGEMSYTVAAVAFAWAGHGGWSIIYANIIQSCVAVFVLIRAAGFASWATPTPLRLARIKDMLKFGLPLGIQGIAHSASRYWDNLAISHFFGTAPLGIYNMAYNLADIPAIQVGEQIALVLMPSMAELPKDRRAGALERSTAMLSLVIFPLAIGLGLVAYPLIGLLLPANKWQEVAPLLAVLACLSVFRPIMWVLSAYLEAELKTNRLMFLEIGKVVLLLGGIAVVYPYGLRVAAGAVGVAFGLTSVAGVLMVMREGPSPARLVGGFVRPLLACAVMGLVVWGVHAGLVLVDLDHPAVLLSAMIVTGAIAYVAAAFVVCRDTVRDVLGMLKKAVKRS